MSFIQITKKSPIDDLYDETKPMSAEQEGREQAEMAEMEEEADEEESNGNVGAEMDERDHKTSEETGREQAEMAKMEEETDKDMMSFIQIAKKSPIDDLYDETKPMSAEQEGR